jgi:hypothetical protein
MTVLSFTITFHSPFRVGASSARDGVTAAIDHDDPLPADHLKGVMRAAAGQLLADPNHPAIGQVFGAPSTPSPWSWSHATPEAPQQRAQDQHPWPRPERRHRVAIDDQTHSAKKDQLVLAEHIWVPTARFIITKVAAIDGQNHEATHRALLRCAAAGVHALGGWRRRGLGWVGITPDDGPVTEDDIAVIQALRQLRTKSEATR